MFKRLGFTFLLLLSSVSYAQSIGDMIQVDSSGLNARKSAFFSGKQNISFKLTEGDFAEILEVTTLPSGNRGLKVRVIKGTNMGRVGWIYFDRKDPDIEIFLASVPTPEPNTHKVIDREVEQIKIKKETHAIKDREILEEYDSYLEKIFNEYNSNRHDNTNDEQTETDLNEIIGNSNNFTSPDVPPSTPVCGDCEDLKKEYPINKLTYQSCPNDAFDKRLKAPLQQALGDMGRYQYDSDFETVLRCVQGGMKSASGNYLNFYHCPSPTSLKNEVTKTKVTPCLSKNLVGTISSEIYLTAKCMGEDYKNILPIFVHESRFFPTVRSFTGASGVGQLTRPAIDTINQSFERKRKEFSKQPGCEYIAKIPKLPSNYLCARTYIPTNPRQNIYYSILYQKLLRDNKYSGPYVQVKNLNKMRNRPFNSYESKQIAEMLLRTGYNSGMGTVNAKFKAYIKSSYNRNQNFNNFMNNFYKYLKAHVREEAANYNKRIIRDTEIMEKNAGTKCTF